MNLRIKNIPDMNVGPEANLIMDLRSSKLKLGFFLLTKGITPLNMTLIRNLSPHIYPKTLVILIKIRKNWDQTLVVFFLTSGTTES